MRKSTSGTSQARERERDQGQGEPEGRSSLGARTWSQRPLSALPWGSGAARLGREGGEAEAAPTPGEKGGGLGRRLGGSEVRASLARGSGEQPGCAGARALSSGERVCPTLRLSGRPRTRSRKRAGETGPEQRVQPAQPGCRLALGALRRSLPRAGCEVGVTSTSRGGQAGRSARARLAGRGSGRGAASTRARVPRAAWAAVPACHCCGAAGRSLEGSGGGGGCSRHLRRRPPGGAEMWPLAAALLLGSCCCGEWLGDPGSQVGAQHPGAPAGVWAAPPPARRHPEESREERRGEGGGMRGPCAPGAPLWEGPAGQRRPCLLPLLSFPSPFLPRGERAEAPHSPVRTRRKTGNNRNCANPNCKESEGAAAGDPPPLLSHPSLLSQCFHEAFGVEGLESGRTGPLVMKCAFW